MNLKELTKAITYLENEETPQKKEEFFEFLDNIENFKELEKNVKITFFDSFKNCYELENYFFSWWDLEFSEEEEKQLKETKGKDFSKLIKDWKGALCNVFGWCAFICDYFIIEFLDFRLAFEG